MILYETDIPDVVNFITTSSGKISLPLSSVFYDKGDGEDVINLELPITDYLYEVNDDILSGLLVNNTNGSYVNTDLSLDLNNVDKENYISTSIDIWKQDINLEYEEIPYSFFIQGILNDGSENINYSFRVNIGAVETNTDFYNEITLAAATYFSIINSIYCASSGTLSSLDCDIHQASGRAFILYSDVYTSILNNKLINSDLYITNNNEYGIQTDINLTVGKRSYVKSDLYNTKLSYNSFIQSDIKLRSIFIGEFFIDSGEFTEADSVGSVDIIDYLYNINEESIYIQKDGTTLSGITIENIPNGKKVYFNPDDDFYSDGEITLRIYAESSIGEVLDQEIYLLYGYNLDLNEVVTWSPNTRVYIRGTAENKVFCKNYEGLSYYFDTVDFDSFDLSASISASLNLSSDINFSIYPQSTAFFYGKTYTVTVSGVKDHSGNVMEPFVYNFTIESPQ